MDITSDVNIKEIGTPTVYVVWRNYATVTMDYNEKGLTVYKSY